MLAVSDAVLNGTDLECGDLYQLLEQGVNKGYLSEKDIDVSLKRLFTILFKIGLFDSEDMSRNPYFSIGRKSWNARHIRHRLMRWLANRWFC